MSYFIQLFEKNLFFHCNLLNHYLKQNAQHFRKTNKKLEEHRFLLSWFLKNLRN